jgi:hypothetical protein
MVETISASPLPQGSGTGSSAQLLEPGTELKARVESNLPGGVVRLATGNARIDLRVAAPLPADAEVTVTVSGSRQQPAVTISVDNRAGRPQAPAQLRTPAGQTLTGQGQSDPASAGHPQAQPGQGYGVIRTTPAGAHLVQLHTPGAGAPATGPATGNPTGNLTANPTGPQASASPGALAAGLGSSEPAQAAGLGGRAQAAATPAAGAAAGASAAPQATASEAVRTVGQVQAPTATAPQGQAGGSASDTRGPVARSAAPGAAGQASPASNPGAAGSAAASPAGPAGTGAPAAAPTVAPAGQPAAGPSSVSPSSAGGVAAGSLAGTVPATSTGAAPPTGPVPGGGAVGAAGQPSVPAPPAGTGSGDPPAGTVRQAAGSPAAPGTAQAASNGNPAAPLGTAASAANTAQPAASSAGPAGQAATPAVPAQPSTPPAATAAPGASAQPSRPAVAPNTLGGQQEGPALRPTTAQPYQQLSAGQAAQPGVNPSSAAAPQGPASELAAGLRQPLAEQQAGLTGLYAQIGGLISAQSAGKVSLPDPVVKAMQQILGLRLNASGPPTAASLQDAVRLSGQFREAQLALPAGGGGTGGPADLKSALLSFRSLLQNLGALPEIVRPAGQPPAPSRHGSPQGQPPQVSGGYWTGAAPQNLQSLLKETDKSLARLRITQLANTGLAKDSGPQSASRPMDLVLELPLALGQETAVLQMQIGRDGAGNRDDGDAEPGWRLRFALDLTATGPLEAAVSLRGGGTYASLWIDRRETFDSLNAVRETMEASFADAGLDLRELRLIRGLPPRTAAQSGARIDRTS